MCVRMSSPLKRWSHSERLSLPQTAPRLGLFLAGAVDRRLVSCSRSSQRVLELVRMFAAVDENGHRAADSGQLIGSGIRDHGHVHAVGALAHRPLVLQDETASFPVQRAGHPFQRDVSAESLTAVSAASI
jgi:hypothetical protein